MEGLGCLGARTTCTLDVKLGKKAAHSSPRRITPLTSHPARLPPPPTHNTTPQGTHTGSHQDHIKQQQAVLAGPGQPHQQHISLAPIVIIIIANQLRSRSSQRHKTGTQGKHAQLLHHHKQQQH